MESIAEHFDRQAQRYQRELEDFEAQGFRYFQFTARGEVDITEELRQELIDARDDYLRVAAHFRA